jgi:hypothetical protein
MPFFMEKSAVYSTVIMHAILYISALKICACIAPSDMIAYIISIKAAERYSYFLSEN